MKRKFLLLALLLVSALISAAPQRKVIDEGGSGLFKAEAVSEKSLPGYAAIKGMDVPAIAGGFQGPSFIVYGDKDGIAAGGVLDAVSARLNKPEIKVIPGGNHGFSNYVHHAQATDGIVGFVTRVLTGRQ